ncbi:MAG: hypothetical protein C0523_02485 [Cytophaga sp.]|nr:hypothetical protein [Cytophaga sp.]
MRFTLLICIMSGCGVAQAQRDTIKSYTTAHLQGEAPKIDGDLNDAAWDQVPWGGGDFRQANPDAGKPASVQTQFKILYDAKNLYIAFLNLDPEPSKIVKRMSRRDGFEGDWVEINIDSYFDKRTAFSFTASVSGVKGDEYVSNNGEDWDTSWDPIWYLKTSVNAEGWVAEVRIPLSQLRFAEKPELTWGFQITRRFFRKQERSLFQYIPPDAAGWVHLFAELRGIKGIKPQKQLEVQPYVVAKTERFEKEEGNPFATGKSSGVDVGLDAKIGITSDVTLDLTVNPDFGQVEADPSQVNLTAFELFFQERRPFFIEGNNTLNFPLSDFNDNNLFYSRRIGRKPQGEVNTDEQGDDGVNEYVKTTGKTTILGAAKLTGKNKKGFSWALLETVTSPEKATIDSLGYRRKQVIEPLTNYFVGRAQQDINKGNTIVGGMLTATTRSIDDQLLDWLHKEAYAGGLDFVHNWKERTYYVSAKTLFSHVNGSSHAMIATQTSSERYFQRPDNNHAHVDSLRKSLTGTGGKLMFGKKSGKLVFDVGLSWLSPQLELNDVGFLLQTDQVKQWVWMQYRLLKQAGIFRSQRYEIMQTSDWDFDKRNTSNSYSANTYLDFKNYWEVGSGVSYETHSLSNADLRGGPAFLYPGNFNYWLYISSDSRKKIQVTINPYWSWGRENYLHSSALDIDFIYRPINSLNITISPNISRSHNELQYVTTASVNNSDRYLVANIDQTIARISLRMTYMITPNLSLQYWGQPFGAAGTYSNFKYIADARASDYSERFINVSSDWIALNDGGQYQIDQNRDGVAEVVFDKPDFNFGQFRSNAVIRWEYIPGSTLFLVWTHERNGAFYDRSDPLHEKYSFDFSQQRAHPVFLIKYTYRFVF